MRKPEKTLFTALLLVLALLLGSCTDANNDSGVSKSMKIGVSLYRGDDAFISSIKTCLESQAKELEHQYNIKITLNIGDAKESQSIQNSQVDDFIEKGYDVICVNLVDRSVASSIIDKAKNADIPIILFNREPVEEDMQLWEKAFYVGADAAEGAIYQAQILIDLYEADPASLDKNGDGVVKYALLEGEPTHQDTLVRSETVINSLVTKGIKIERLANDTAYWMRAQAKTKMESWLEVEEFADAIEVVICNNDEMALGAIEALSESERDDVVVVGIDGTSSALNEVIKGRLTGTVLNDASAQTSYILEIACCVTFGEGIENLTFLDGQYARAPHRMVTKENAREELERMQ